MRRRVLRPPAARSRARAARTLTSSPARGSRSDLRIVGLRPAPEMGDPFAQFFDLGVFGAFSFGRLRGLAAFQEPIASLIARRLGDLVLFGRLRTPVFLLARKLLPEDQSDHHPKPNHPGKPSPTGSVSKGGWGIAVALIGFAVSLAQSLYGAVAATTTRASCMELSSCCRSRSRWRPCCRPWFGRRRCALLDRLRSCRGRWVRSRSGTVRESCRRW